MISADLVRRTGLGRGSGAVQDAGDIVRFVDNHENAHPAAALAADGDIEGEHAMMRSRRNYQPSLGCGILIAWPRVLHSHSWAVEDQ